MKKNILITGGAGFIGANLAKRCISEGYEVLIVDNLSTGMLENIPEGAQFVNMDIAQGVEYEILPNIDFDVIFHLAAQSSGEISNEKPELDLVANTLGTLLLLKWCMKKNIKRFIYASSMAVYGDTTNVPVPENEPCKPLSFYGITKLAGEHYVQHFYREELQTTCFRMFSVYGPGQNMENLKQGMVSIFMAYLLKGEPILVKGSKDRFRDFIYIDDVVEAWMQALDNPNSSGKIYNLGTRKKTHVYELIREEIKALGLDPDSYPVKYEGTTPSDQFGLYADISKIKADIGWNPEVSLADGLQIMIKWAKNKYKYK
jgi:UDP-glucose 4-epimerase